MKEGYAEDGEYYEDAEASGEEPVAEAVEETVETVETELQAEEETTEQTEQQDVDASDSELGTQHKR